MAEYILIGRVVAISDTTTETSSLDPTKTFERKKLYLDCSRYDSITQEMISENFPLVEFGGKGLEQLTALQKQGLTKGDLVSIKFAVDGRSYKDKTTGKTKNFTGIRPYAIERYVPRPRYQQQGAQAAPVQAAPAPAPQPSPAPQVAQPQAAQPAQAQPQPVYASDPNDPNALPF
jgi:hypothetical protein